MTEGTALQRRDLALLWDKQAISHCLASHARGIDRADIDLLSSLYQSDAQVDYGFLKGQASTVLADLVALQRQAPVTYHRPANVWVRVNGDRAVSESYVIACAESVSESGAMQSLIGGRYLDQHQFDQGRWCIRRRSYVLDWNIIRPSTANLAEASLASGHFVAMGGHGARDPGNFFLASHSADFYAGKRSEKNMSPRELSAADIDSMVSRQTLHELLSAYCRGVDRGDEALLASVFHDDATVMSGVYNGPASTFVPEILRSIEESSERVFHSLNNHWFDIDGDRAVGECYALAVQTVDSPDGLIDILVGGRYLNRFERRHGVWKIVQHTFVLDWNMIQPCTAVMDEGMFGDMTQGTRSLDDPVYSLWGSLS